MRISTALATALSYVFLHLPKAAGLGLKFIVTYPFSSHYQRNLTSRRATEALRTSTPVLTSESKTQSMRLDAAVTALSELLADGDDALTKHRQEILDTCEEIMDIDPGEEGKKYIYTAAATIRALTLNENVANLFVEKEEGTRKKIKDIYGGQTTHIQKARNLLELIRGERAPTPTSLWEEEA